MSVHKYWLQHEDPATAQPHWLVAHAEPNGKRTTKRGFTTKRDAEAYEARVATQKADGTYVTQAAQRTTIAELAPGWIARHEARVEKSTHHPIPGTYRLHVEPTWGKRRIGTIKKSEVEDWALALRKGKSHSTVSCALGILAGILESARSDGMLNANPARNIKLPKKNRPKDISLTFGQVELLAECSAHPTLVRFLAYTGLRWSEAIGLRVRCVDTKRHRVQVQQTAVQVRAAIIIKDYPKTDSSWRDVVYPVSLAAAMRDQVGERRGEDLVFSSDGRTHMRRPDSRDGWFANAVRRAQAQDPDLPRITPHGLRHTYVTLALASGASPSAVRDSAGHEGTDVTLRVYASVNDKDRMMTADLIDQARNRARDDNGPEGSP